MPAFLLAHGASTNLPTIFRTIGKTTSKVGKATIQDSPQACIHTVKKSAVRPTPRKVEMAEMMKVMMMDKTNGSTTAA